MSSQDLIIEQREDVLWLTINRPAQRNALNLALLDDIGATLDRYQASDALRCVVITAAGDKAFAAGGDLKELDTLRSDPEALAMSQRVRAALDRVRAFPLPVIAGLNGLALGGGAELAMACDLRVAAAHAEIGFLQGQLNVTTAWGGGIDLLLAAGPTRGLDLLLSARRIGAAECLEFGLINRLAGPEESLQECLADFMRPYLARSPGVLRGYKALTGEFRRTAHAQLAETEQANFVRTWVHGDHWDAVAAAARQREAARNRKA